MVAAALGAPFPFARTQNEGSVRREDKEGKENDQGYEERRHHTEKEKEREDGKADVMDERHRKENLDTCSKWERHEYGSRRDFELLRALMAL